MFDRARGPDEVLSRLVSLVSTARYDRADLTPPQLDEAINLIVAIMESGKKRPFEREPDEIYPLDNWADVHEHMVDLITACLSKADALSKDTATRHGDQVLDLVEYLFEYTHGKLGTNPRNGPFALDDDGVDDYAESSQYVRAVLFRGPAGIVRELRLDPDAQGSETLSRAWDLCRQFIERETDGPPAREFGRHVRHLYEWDTEWMRAMAGHVFPAAATDKERFLAAIGSFLSKDPTEAMFFDPVFRDLYRRAMDLTEKDAYDLLLPDPAFSIGRIFAHAHLRFEGFGPDHPLFKEFLKTGTRRQLEGFVERTRTHILLDSPSGLGFDTPRVIASWERLLDRPDPGILHTLGDWICLRSRVFTPDELADLTLRTMRMTGGGMHSGSELLDSVEELAAKVPGKTLEILELYFRPDNLGKEHDRRVLYLCAPTRWHNAIETLSKNPRTQERARQLDEFLAEVRREAWREQEKKIAELAKKAKVQ